MLAYAVLRSNNNIRADSNGEDQAGQREPIVNLDSLDRLSCMLRIRPGKESHREHDSRHAKQHY